MAHATGEEEATKKKKAQAAEIFKILFRPYRAWWFAMLTRAFSPGFKITGFQPCDGEGRLVYSGGGFDDSGFGSGVHPRNWLQS
jgi:hypothetical protein